MIGNLNRKQGPYWERSGELRPNQLQFPLTAKRGRHKISARSSLVPETQSVLEWKTEGTLL